MSRGLSASFIARYFCREGDEWVARPEIRALCRFREANLCASLLPFSPPAQFDIILLRNVMLYFAPETRRSVLAGIRNLLAPDGCLFLGSTEQPGDPSLWTPVLSDGTCYYRSCRDNLEF